MNAPRYNHTETRLDGPACRGIAPPDYCGDVLVTGGEAVYVSQSPTATLNTPTAGTLSSTELYDSVTNTWTTKANMTGPRSRHTATLLDGPACQTASPPSYCGQVLVVGGSDSKYTADVGLATVELYNPATNTWTPKMPMGDQHHLHTATLLNNNKVLVVGGFPRPHAAQVYDPAANSWAYTAPAIPVVDPALGPQYQTAFGHARHSATKLGDGTVLVVGGCVLGFLNAPACPAERYNPDPINNGWLQQEAPLLSTFNHTATLLTGPNCALNCGKVLVAGGSFVRGLSSSDGNAVLTANRAELFDPAATTGQWTPTGTMNSMRARHTANLLTTGQVLVAGGKDESLDRFDPVNTSERYDPAIGTWEPTAGPMTSNRAAHTATLLSNGEVLAAGGFASGVVDPIPLSASLTGFTPINTTERYTP